MCLEKSSSLRVLENVNSPSIPTAFQQSDTGHYCPELTLRPLALCGLDFPLYHDTSRSGASEKAAAHFPGSLIISQINLTVYRLRSFLVIWRNTITINSKLGKANTPPITPNSFPPIKIAKIMVRGLNPSTFCITLGTIKLFSNC